MPNLTSTKQLVQVALLRRRVLLRQTIRRAIAGALALAALIVAAGLVTYAVFLVIRTPLGELGAILAIAGFYLAVAIVLLIYTLHEPASPELDALAEMEHAALESFTADTQGFAQAFTGAGAGVSNLSNTIALSISVVTALRKLLATARERKAP
jgi:hypothetical protein